MMKNISLVYLLTFFLVYFLFEFLNAPVILESEFLLRILIMVGIGTFIFFCRYEPQRSLRKQYFRVSTIFLVGFILVHFQIYVDYVLGNYNNFGHDYLINPRVVPKSIVISAIALFCFYIGYLLKSNRIMKQKFAIGADGQMHQVLQTAEKSVKVYPVKGLILLGYIFFGLFIMNANWKYFQGQYGKESLGGTAQYFQTYLILAINAIILINCWNLVVTGARLKSFMQYVKAQGVFLLGLILLYVPLVVMSGDRGPVLQIVTIYFGGYIIVTLKKLKLQHIVALLAVAVFAVSAMGLARSMSDKDSYFDKLKSVDELKMSQSSANSFSPNTMELATVVRTMHAAVNYTENHGHAYGVYQLYQIVGIIPGFGVVFRAITGLSEAQVNSGIFLTQEILGTDADYGLGTTCVADLYLDLGIFGVLGAFILFGVFLRFLEEKAFTDKLPSLFVWIMIFVFLSKAVYIGRSSIIILFRECVLTFAIIMIGVAISKILFKNSKQKKTSFAYPLSMQ